MATTIDVISGFLGAGKTTLIKKLLKEALAGEQVVLIENEFGEIGIDGGFLKDAGIQITEMSQGCICCTLVGDFGRALQEVLDTYHPDRILIEPSGVGKLSDVVRAVHEITERMPEVKLGGSVTVADVTKCRMYIKNFGEFYNNQIESAGTIVLSRTQKVSEDQVEACVALLREHNPKATIITTPWDDLSGKQILEAMLSGTSLEEELLAAMVFDDDEECDDPECECHHHHHHHHDGEECDDPECECHHHHHDDDDDDDDEHEHHHHHHDDDDDEHEHEHHHHDDDDDEHHHHHHDDDDDEHEHHHHHHHHHHHGHDADEIFASWGFETSRKYTEEEIRQALAALEDGTYGTILRAKGYVPADGEWIHFDYVPGEAEVRHGVAEVIGRLCVIGSELKEDKLAELFRK